MANTTGEKELRRDWPNISGLTAGTTKQEGRKPHLEAEGLVDSAGKMLKSAVPERKKKGL